MSIASFSRCMSSTSSPETREFQAETRKLLDIVTHSIYTDKEVFLRELISNASDALEKLRYKQVSGEIASSNENPLEIQLFTDKNNKTLTLVDTGIGMTKEELISNLGTIARSGSRSFVEQLKSDDSKRSVDNIIGQFGVGFYSSFMVSDKVTVEGKSATNPDSTVYKWSSDGSGVYTIEGTEATDLSNGCRITLHLKDSCAEYSDPERIKTIIKKYSSFVTFPIKLNGEEVNTVTALWTQDKKEVTSSQYNEFYKFFTNDYDSPRYTLHFKTDAPIDLKCLFFVPSSHTEKFGMGRIEPGVNLYSRKILIESKPKDLLPEWLRFMKGVVDSEDLPLSISREKPQDSNLLRRMREVLTRKIIKFFEDCAKNDIQAYREFYIEFNIFIKEGICSDSNNVDSLSKLLRFESSISGEDSLISFDEYVANLKPTDKYIYYLMAPSRDVALSSPYYETFRKHNKDVLFVYNTIDDFVMSNIKTFNSKKIISIESSEVDLDKELSSAPKETSEETKDKEEIEEKKESDSSIGLSEAESNEICDFIMQSLGDKKLRQCKITNRLSDSPCIVTDHQSGALRKMMKLLEQSNQGTKSNVLPPQVLEINPKHPLVINIYKCKERGDTEIAKLVVEQLFDNALIAAGLLDDPRLMIPRLNELLLATINK
eukprot:CAMPEP_0196767680 /NCGR_PEP_ID=MMETSP1095-20130614/41847_1 /TAXON_ID=96789 ORGANISM="Chromulina nebulosa, Strain UTEXLB2642" /NCGR_SAMPLE_ID=MMETSP1095 /ASSEMBLY_ACC=CAM_ASM_000446 /LENGTH=657 /DNA_ID=CAMNT_0042136213 /DNA_START=146 /DNA_END=2119 /DNA_ORIENTATION=+